MSDDCLRRKGEVVVRINCKVVNLEILCCSGYIILLFHIVLFAFP